ncbi:MAG: DUF1508 domain-containing protein [Acidobacteria bacterium]|nr:MAG: DUF1508 domain-containing protein [Acidobacteriota bacterium]
MTSAQKDDKTYSSAAAMENGVQSVKANAPTAVVDDSS